MRTDVRIRLNERKVSALIMLLSDKSLKHAVSSSQKEFAKDCKSILKQLIDARKKNNGDEK
jgi:hypothetical protein